LEQRNAAYRIVTEKFLGHIRHHRKAGKEMVKKEADNKQSMRDIQDLMEEEKEKRRGFQDGGQREEAESVPPIVKS
jgi:hypothetical protein